MKVYLASSWRNERQPIVLQALRSAGHDVYDFRNPSEGNTGFSWREISPDWQQWTPEQYRTALDHPVAKAGFASDMRALEAADACVMLQKCGVSAALELAWAKGAGLYTVALLAQGEPELMLAMCDAICLDVSEVLSALRSQDGRRFPLRSFCVSCRTHEDAGGACDCTGNTRNCDSRRGPYGKPCDCWVCVAKRDGKDPREVLRQAKLARVSRG